MSKSYGEGAPPPPAAPDATASMAGGKDDKKEGAKDSAATTWKRSQLGAHNIRIKVGDYEELPVRSLQAKVNVDGFMARVVLDILVKNERSRNYEGTFQLRLPEGASPYYFAFGENTLEIAADKAAPPPFDLAKVRTMGSEPDEIATARSPIWRGVKEAQVVPKEKAAFAYTETVRRKIDPALVEWSGPSIFSARVFPLTAGVAHRIVVGYDVPLTRIAGDLQYDFDVPEKIAIKVIDIAVSAASGTAIDVTPKTTGSVSGTANYYHFEDPTAKTLSVRLQKPGQVYLTGSDSSIGSYFAADVAPNLGKSGTTTQSDSALFLVDTSLSSNPDRFNIWLKLLAAILENNRDSIKRFNVGFFNIEQHFYKDSFVDNNEANQAALIAYANSLILEGATDVDSALRAASKPPGASTAGAPSRWNVFLLSDGAATWGESDFFNVVTFLQKTPVAAVYSYQTGTSGTDSDALQLIARETGGAVFSVTGDAEVKSASTAHRSQPWKLKSVSLAGATDLMIQGRPRYVYPGQHLTLVGRGVPDKGAQVELVLEQNGTPQTVKTPIGQSLATRIATRAYGQIAVGQLEELLPTTNDVAKAYAVQYRITGKTCSLVMLDSPEDYKRFGIGRDDDTLVVKQSEASNLVQKTLDTLAGRLGNPKASFAQWLATLHSMPGMSFSLPTSVKMALEKMPESSFRVEAAPLATKQHDRSAVPDAFLTALSTHKVEYDPFTTEAERRRTALGNGDALKCLSSLVEENPGDTVLMRDIGVTAMTWGLSADSYHLFRRVASARPFEPQTYRAMAQALVRLGKIDLAIIYFEIGLNGKWDSRFGEFRKILAVEYLELLRRIANGELSTNLQDLAKDRLNTLASEIKIGRADLVVMITWNTDNTDVDLHVVEPSGEECFFSHRKTRAGGQITQDVRLGYGPEMYVIEHAPQGGYSIMAKYFASDSNRATARTKVHAMVFEDFGSPKQRMTEKIVTLTYGKEKHDILQVQRGPGAQIAVPLF